jgi:hypothetical protein
VIAALMEGIAFVASIASISLLCGLLRASKIYSQATEDQLLAPGDTGGQNEPATSDEQSPTQTALRNVS